MKQSPLVIVISILFIMIVGCNSNFTPKPRGYAQVQFPTGYYKQFNLKNYPYQFEYPSYAYIQKDSSIFEHEKDNEFWINIQFPSLGGTIYLSYKDIKKSSLEKIINECFHLAARHTVKATSIDEYPIHNSNKVSGLFFVLQGDVATANQFYVTDSVKHFLRGTLYFNTAPNEDSLKIVNDFIVKDMYHLINTLKWKN
ncbi:MAG: hypothetical protein QM539_00970 [Alphaproteobacteria bacterium]|nr:hypothetical protein [Alphaproteobacteria bacterium]